jgi:predicted transcriptional regulator
MTLREVQTILDARLLTGEELLDRTVNTACGSDLMSDVLAYVKDQALLLTGLVNQQVIRTAEMMDMVCVIFVRDKEPGQEILDLAREKGIAVMSSPHRMFTSCGLLYQAGLNGGLAIR